MSWFTKKIDANYGVILVAASTALSAIKFAGANQDGEALAAFGVGYVGFQAPSFGVSRNITDSDVLWQAAWEAAAIEHEYFRERPAPFAFLYATALDALGTDTPNAHFFAIQHDAVGWNIDRDSCISFMRSMRDGIDQTLADKSRDWK